MLKTHTPLDGVPLVDGVTYVVPARHPLDAAVSLRHQGDDLDHEAVARLSGTAPRPSRPRPEPARWLAGWVDDDPDPVEALDSLPGVAQHLRDAWARGADRADHRRDGRHDVVLVHDADLLADLPGQVRRLADLAGLEASDEQVDGVADATTFAAMRGRAADLAPDAGVLRSRAAFFRGGRSGDGRVLASSGVQSRYDARVRALLPDDLRTWLHR